MTVDPLDENASRERSGVAIRDVRPFTASAPTGDRPLWRVSVPPARGVELGPHCPRPSAQMFYDWAGGLIWIAPLPASDDGGAAMVRQRGRHAGRPCHADRAPAAVRAAVDVFEPQPAPRSPRDRRVKESFDPKGVLNPGRMWAGV